MVRRHLAGRGGKDLWPGVQVARLPLSEEGGRTELLVALEYAKASMQESDYLFWDPPGLNLQPEVRETLRIQETDREDEKSGRKESIRRALWQTLGLSHPHMLYY